MISSTVDKVNEVVNTQQIIRSLRENSNSPHRLPTAEFNHANEVQVEECDMNQIPQARGVTKRNTHMFHSTGPIQLNVNLLERAVSSSPVVPQEIQ